MSDLERIKPIFSEALDKKGADRESFLNEVCREDPDLKAEVEALLKAHEGAGDFLEAPVFDADVTLDDSPISEGPGTVIGRYKLLEKIGEGGMAVVYMAEQQEPIRRKVALKIIKLGMDTKSVIARFEAERQALAMMDHPNIAKVLDAGATETGRPYFVMELVKGVSITEYCDKNSLSTAERLELFIQVCNAVQHAHQKGIIHRDIKPSNVMVTHHDGKPVPKVIDFGIAKAINQKLTEKTLFTRYAHIIGTPAYMSPEQAELSDLDIDTRTDIYSLGVLLYELLTGAPPFGEEELRKAGYIEMQRIIREQEPVKPSTKLSTLGKTLTDIANLRDATPEVLTKAIRGDLDWIVMKSLEKDRARRYETANGLALDIQRHLEHEPVLARGPSTTYRLEKFLRRHRSKTIAVLALAVAAGVLIVILSMWNQAQLQLDEAQEFSHRGILSQAREQYAKADRDAVLETIKPILDSKHVGPEAQLLYAGILVDNRRSPVRDALWRDEAVTVLNGLLDDRAEIAGAAHALLARILYESESPNAETLKQAEQHRQKAEALLPETAEAYFLRAMFAMTVKEQFAALNEALELDLQHYESRRLRAYTYYASRKYDKMKDDALAMTILRPRDPLGYSLRTIALRELGKYAEAIAEYDNAIALTPKDDPQYMDLRTQRNEVFLRMGDYERVIADAQECLKLSPDKPASVAGILPALRGRDALDTSLQYYKFCALTALGDYERAAGVFAEIVRRTPTARNEFRDWCTKYVFDTLEAGRSWHPASRAPARDLGAAFLPMVEAEETYRSLSTKGRRVIADGFSPSWSPDGSKLTFAAGVLGYSGVAVFDLATKETELLMVPGKDPRWSPDGKYIAFVRDCQFLRVSEFIALEPRDQRRLKADEEVWVMHADGTQPRRLARGGSPSWSRDSARVYYHSRVDSALCSISIEAGEAEPKQIMKCSHEGPALSPDQKRVAYIEGARLKVKDLTSQTVVAEWPVLPTMLGGGVAWSATGHELCLGSNSTEGRIGLCIYALGRAQPVKVLTGPIGKVFWSLDGTKLALRLGLGQSEIWAANLDPNVSIIEALGPAQTLDEHVREMVAFHTRRIEADPEDAYAYSGRAHYYDCLPDREKAKADMRRWSAVLSGSDLQAAAPQNTRRVINGLFGHQFVFSAERPVNKIPLLNVALGRKGRCSMKPFQVPILSMSLLRLCLLAGLDAPTARADFTFGEPVNLESVIPVLDAAHDGIVCLSSDGLEIYIESDRPGGSGDWDLWVLSRTSIGDDWRPPENLGPTVNSSGLDTGACVSANGLELYFSSRRPGGYGWGDTYVTTRMTKSDPWGAPANLGPRINTSADDGLLAIAPNGLELYFESLRVGGYGGGDIYVARRATTNDPWGEPVNIGPVVNSAYQEHNPSLSPDGLILLFCDNQFLGLPRPGGYGRADIWVARRASLSDPWQAPVNLGPKVNGPDVEGTPRSSPDGRTLYFWTGHDAATWNNWQAPIIPICDFNGDGKVDGKDVLCMASRWGTDDPLCDIGPFAWGDGNVALEDLTVLAEYIGKEVTDPALIAHWTLDESEGSAAHESVGGGVDIVVGSLRWQPSGGQVDGALQLDGVSDCVVSSFVLNPSAGPFSVLAWVKGGAPGQVVISEPTRANWLMADAEGKLMTELSSPNWDPDPLQSQTIITDGQWHRIGLVWDGSRRMLYVDGVVAAEDTQSALPNSGNGLYIGTGKNMEPGTFFSGLIDDVRIYKRAVRP
jgi:serine/threonine protein kinase